MTLMKLLIIGLDGLDHDLVERWRLAFYKQKHYGKHYVGFLKTLYTPIIWSCFLTGMDVTTQGYSLNQLRTKRSMDSLHPILRPIYKLRVKILRGRRLFVRGLLVRLRLVKAHPPSIMPKHLIKKTFLNIMEEEIGIKVYAIEVPGYNERINEKYRSEYIKLINATINEKLEYIKGVLADCEERIGSAIKGVADNYDTIFLYLPLPDIAHHLLFKGLTEITYLRQHYGKLSRMLEPLVDKASNKGYRILMVSDHGFDLNRYYHSDYGFWSINFDPPKWWKIESVLDFKENLLKLIRSGSFIDEHVRKSEGA